MINNKLYKIKKDNTENDLYGSYIDGKIIEEIKQHRLTKKIIKHNTE